MPDHNRAPNRTKAMQAAGEYWIMMCANCHHPGGAHIIVEWEPRVTRCQCCTDCPGWVNGEYGIWSDDLAGVPRLPYGDPAGEPAHHTGSKSGGEGK